MRMKLNPTLVLPKTINNDYKGHKISLYAFYLITILTVVRSILHIFLPDGGAQSIATIPLDAFPEDASNAIVFIFAYWGLSQFLMGIFYSIVAIRYRSLVPLMYIFLFIEYTGRLIIGCLKPLILVGTAPGGVGNYIAIPLIAIMFLLSILQKYKSERDNL